MIHLVQSTWPWVRLGTLCAVPGVNLRRSLVEGPEVLQSWTLSARFLVVFWS